MWWVILIIFIILEFHIECPKKLLVVWKNQMATTRSPGERQVWKFNFTLYILDVQTWRTVSGGSFLSSTNWIIYHRPDWLVTAGKFSKTRRGFSLRQPVEILLNLELSIEIQFITWSNLWPNPKIIFMKMIPIGDIRDHSLLESLVKKVLVNFIFSQRK